MSCGANHNRRVAHALNRRSTHVAKVATQTAKHKAVAKPVKRKTTRPATKKKTTAPKKHATKTAAATARAKAKAKAAKKFHLSAAVKARMRAKARATARAHALATLRKDHAAWLACHNRYRRSAPKVRHHDTRVVVRLTTLCTSLRLAVCVATLATCVLRRLSAWATRRLWLAPQDMPSPRSR